MSEFELIIKKLEIVKDTEENGCYICDKEHSKILLDGINKYKEVLDKIKEYIKENNNQEPWKSVQGDYILELLEEIDG
jgi:hypothetical protein